MYSSHTEIIFTVLLFAPVWFLSDVQVFYWRTLIKANIIILIAALSCSQLLLSLQRFGAHCRAEKLTWLTFIYVATNIWCPIRISVSWSLLSSSLLLIIFLLLLCNKNVFENQPTCKVILRPLWNLKYSFDVKYLQGVVECCCFE